MLGGIIDLDRLVHNKQSEGEFWPGFAAYDCVIAADSGQKTAAALGLIPDIYVGDFDSSAVPEGVLKHRDGKTRTVQDLEAGRFFQLAPHEFVSDSTKYAEMLSANPEGDLVLKSTLPEVIVLPSEKDTTDSEAAIDLAYEMGFRDIDVLGGLSGRLDHTLGNLGILAKYLGRAHLQFFDGTNMVTMLNPGCHLMNAGGYRYLGLIAYGENVQGLSLRGTKYEVSDFTLPPDTTRGISNEITAESAQISFRKGRLLAVKSWERN